MYVLNPSFSAVIPCFYSMSFVYIVLLILEFSLISRLCAWEIVMLPVVCSYCICF